MVQIQRSYGESSGFDKQLYIPVVGSIAGVIRVSLSFARAIQLLGELIASYVQDYNFKKQEKIRNNIKDTVENMIRGFVAVVPFFGSYYLYFLDRQELGGDSTLYRFYTEFRIVYDKSKSDPFAPYELILITGVVVSALSTLIAMHINSDIYLKSLMLTWATFRILTVSMIVRLLFKVRRTWKVVYMRLKFNDNKSLSMLCNYKEETPKTFIRFVDKKTFCDDIDLMNLIYDLYFKHKQNIFTFKQDLTERNSKNIRNIIIQNPPRFNDVNDLIKDPKFSEPSENPSYEWLYNRLIYGGNKKRQVNKISVIAVHNGSKQMSFPNFNNKNKQGDVKIDYYSIQNKNQGGYIVDKKGNIFVVDKKGNKLTVKSCAYTFSPVRPSKRHKTSH